MKDNLRIDKEYPEFFLLDEAKLRKIVEIIQGHSSKKTDIKTEFLFEIVHKDNSNYQTDNLENVLSDENIEGREITSIVIILKKSEAKYSWIDPICRVKFSSISKKYSYDKPIEYKIDDNDKAWVYSLGEELDLYVKRTLKGNKKNILIILEWIDNIVPTVIFCLALLLLFKIYPDFNIKLGEVSLVQTLIGLPLIIIIVAALYSIYEIFEPFTKLSKILQGESIFYLGDQIEKYDKRLKMMSNLTWVVIVGFLVSLIAGLVIALTTK